MNEFSLSIHLGNAAAMDEYAIAEALESVADEVLRRIMRVVDDMPGVSIETVRANGRPGANIINLFVDAGRTFGASPMQSKAALIRYNRKTNR